MRRCFLPTKAHTPPGVCALPAFMAVTALGFAFASLRVALAAPMPTPPPPGQVANLTGHKPKIDTAGELAIRAKLHLAGFGDPAILNPIMTFVRQREQARASLLRTADKLSDALAKPDYDKKKLSDLCDTFFAEIDEERDRNAEAEKNLDAQIHWTTNKRLTATLLLAGIVGDTAGVLDSLSALMDSDEGSEPENDAPGNGTPGEAKGMR